MTNNTVPFLDLVTPHLELKEELLAVCARAFDTAGFIGGSMVSDFEKEFAAFVGVRHCVAVNSGTDALRFAYIAGGVKTGDLVITVPNTFIATTEAISQAGAAPVFVDVDERTYNLDPAKAREYLQQCLIKDGRPFDRQSGRPVTAIVPVHLYGQCADMDPIMDLAQEFGLIVFEDACQAHGAEYFSSRRNVWLKAGSIGTAAAFSFYPGKNLGACGEAGAITTNDDEIAKKCRMLRDHGQAQKYYHDIEGYNGRLDAIQCGLLSAKLKRLPQWNQARRDHAKRYSELLKNAGVTVPFEPQWSKAVYHLYVIRSTRRDALQSHLNAHGISTGMHYPVPLHRQKAYAGMTFHNGGYPVTEKLAGEILSLPMFPGLTEDQMCRVAEALKTI